MLPEGSYVPMKSAPNTRMATIHSHNDPAHQNHILFRHDPRFTDSLGEVYLLEDEVELCPQPTGVEVAQRLMLS